MQESKQIARHWQKILGARGKMEPLSLEAEASAALPVLYRLDRRFSEDDKSLFLYVGYLFPDVTNVAQQTYALQVPRRPFITRGIFNLLRVGYTNPFVFDYLHSNDRFQFVGYAVPVTNYYFSDEPEDED